MQREFAVEFRPQLARIELHTSTIYSAHRRVGCYSVLGRSDHILALITEDLECFVQDDRSSGKIGQQRMPRPS
jgi:hypothetical protein